MLDVKHLRRNAETTARYVESHGGAFLLLDAVRTVPLLLDEIDRLNASLDVVSTRLEQLLASPPDGRAVLAYGRELVRQLRQAKTGGA